MNRPETCDDIIRRFEALADATAAKGMARYGITAANVYGIKIPVLRAHAKEIGLYRELALALWRHDSREARILAGMIDDPSHVTDSQMES